MTATILTEMANDLGLLASQIETIVRTAPLRYKVFHVKKRSGGRRQLAQPAKEVKWLQYWLMKRLRNHLPVHQAVAAYEDGCSIRRNAKIHSNGRFLLKMDLTNFFPSITENDFKDHLMRFAPETYSQEDLEVMSQVLFWAPERRRPLRLCIGAPSSPMISNSVMYEFDKLVEDHAIELDVLYTRYADDLTFSARTPNRLRNMPEAIEKILTEIAYPRLRVNNRKTIHASRATRRVVTGIVITPQGQLSTGRDRKRLARSMFHRARLGMLDEHERAQMEGLICFIESIEPGFREKLMRGHGTEDV